MSFLKSLGYDCAYHVARGDEFLADKKYGEARIEYLKAYEICLTDSSDTSEIDAKIAQCNEFLAAQHLEWAEGYESSEEYLKAVSAFNMVIDLLKDDAKREEIKKKVSVLLEKNLDKEAQEAAAEFVERGDEFIKNNDIAEAFTEYKQAYFFVKDVKCDFTKTLEKKLSDVEERLARPYYENAEKLFDEGKIDEAKDEIYCAISLTDDFNRKLINEINDLKDKIERKSAEDSPEGDYVAAADWDRAIADYREALNKYLTFQYNSSDMILPVYVNKFEREYFNAKQALGKLYLKRAEGFFKDKNNNIAERIFIEARNFISQSSEEWKKTEDYLKQIRYSRK